MDHDNSAFLAQGIKFNILIKPRSRLKSVNMITFFPIATYFYLDYICNIKLSEWICSFQYFEAK